MTVGKKFLIILLIIFLVSITGVSAIEAPVNDTGVNDASISAGVDDVKLDVSSGDEGDLSSVADENQIVNDDENLTAVAGDGQANDEVLGASDDNDVLGADPLQSYTSSATWDRDYDARSTQTVKGENVIINGDGHTVSGLNARTIFRVTAYTTGTIFHTTHYSSVTFKNINFINGKGENGGGAVYIESGNTVTFENCKFISNTAAAGSAGAVYGAQGVADVTFRNCLFKDNSLSKGGSDKKCYGGAMYLHTPNAVIMDNCTFINNYIKVTDNSANDISGGAVLIYNAKTVEIKNKCNFTNNYIEDKLTSVSGLLVEGGAAFISVTDQIKITETTFHNNRAVAHDSLDTGTCGGLYLRRDIPTVEITSCNFKNNVAKKGSGALQIDGNDKVTMEHCIFDNNQGEIGAGVYFSGTVGKIKSGSLINDCTFINNNVTTNGGAVFVSSEVSGLSFTNCKFTNNNATMGTGGAIHFDGKCSNIGISGTSFDSNTATTGGAIQFNANAEAERNTNINIVSSNFTANKATGYRGYGGSALMFNPTTNIDLVSCRFEDNVAVPYGAVFLDYCDDINFDKCKFINNNATKSAAAVFYNRITDDSNSTFNGCTFDGNVGLGTASNGNDGTVADGGALYLLGSNHKITGNTFSNNKILNYYQGGALSSGTCNNVDIIGNDFINNSANRGGAIYMNGVTNINLKDSTFDGNSARGDDGAISLTTSTESTTIYNCDFSNNKAGGSNGALELLGAKKLIVDKCTFTNNTANSNGALYIYSENGIVRNSVFKGNNVTANAGAVYAGNKNVAISNSNFTANHAGGSGGAIYFESDGGIISYCNFINNTATNGGAMVLANDNQKVQHATFTGNDATNGGAIYALGKDNIEISDSTFENNTARKDGGAIHYDGTATNGLTISNTIFKKNIAVYNGGAVHYLVDGTVHYRDCNKFEGEATGDSTLTWNHASKQIIYNSLFEGNDDYYFNVTKRDASLRVTYTITVPNRAKKASTVVTVTILNVATNETQTFTFRNNDIEDEDWIIDDANNLTKIRVYVDYPQEGKYNTTVAFSDENHDEKYDNESFNLMDVHSADEGGFQKIERLIREAIARAEANDEPEVIVRLTESEYVYTPGLDYGHINVTYTQRPITIIGINDDMGTRPTIDAKGFCRIFEIYSNNFTITNVVLTNGNASGSEQNSSNNVSGGAILWVGSNGVLNNSVVHGNTAQDGGAIFVQGTSLNITNTEFRQNTAENGGAIYWNATDGNVSGSKFTNNGANHTGGAIYMGADNNYIYDSSFTGNTANQTGGAVELNASSYIVLSNFTNNHAEDAGGAVHVSGDNAEVTDSTFTLNTATKGGAVDLNASSPVKYSTFTENSAENGGAIYVSAAGASVDESIFNDNTASENGGAIDINATSQVTNSNFTNNNAQNGGAINVEHGADNTNIIGSNFTENTAAQGGAINVAADGVEIETGRFEENHGGAVYFDKVSDFHVDGSDFIANDGQNGSAIYIDNSTGKIEHSEFNSNAAVGSAAIAIANSNGVNVTDSTFYGNQANSGSADISVTGSSDIMLETLTVTNSHGATSSIYIDSDVTMDDINMSGWSSSPAVLFDGGNSTMMNSALDGNNAIKITEDAEVHLIRNNNTNAAGGEYSVSNNGTLYLEKNIFTNQIWVEVAGKINTTTTTRILNNETVIIKIGDDAFVNATIVDDNNNTIHVRTLELIANTTDIDTYCDGKTHYGTFVNPAQGTYLLSAKGIDGLLKNDLKTSTLNVKDADVSLNLDITQELAGEIVKIKATVNCHTPLTGGNVTFIINGQKHSYFLNTTEDLNGFTVTLPLNNITPDNYKVTAIYNGDDTHFNCSANGEFTVEKRDSNVSVFVENIFVGQYAVVNVNSIAYNGTVTLMFNGREEEIEIRNGKGIWTIPDLLEEGTYFITAIYNKNSYYESSFSSTSFKVIDYSIDVDVNETQFNQSAKIIVTLPEGAIGNTSTVSIYLNGTKLTNVTTADGKTFIAYTDNLEKVGEYEVNVTYMGNATYPSTYKNGTMFNVTPLKDYEIKVNVTAAPFGKDTVINVTAPAGIKQVNLTVGGATYVVDLTDGVGSKTLNNLTVGDYVAVATFAGNENYTAKTAEDSFEIVPADPEMRIVIVPGSPVSPGSDVNITVVVGKNATKKVIVYVGDDTYVVPVGADGNATVIVKDVKPGIKNVTAEYMGDKNYNAAKAGPVQFNVSKYDSEVSWNATVSDSNNVTFIIKFNSTATGNVSIKVGDKYYSATIENGVARVNVGILNSTDANEFTANYTGDDTFNSKLIPVNATVGKLRNATMSVDITTPTEFGNVTTITVAVPGVTDGNVKVWVNETQYNATKVADGIYQVITPALPVGNYVVNVTYFNSTQYADITQKGYNLTVKRNDSYVLDVSVSPAPYGENTTITVTGPANVNVTVTVDGVNYTVSLNASGVGEKVLDNLTAGKHEVIANFTGNENYTAKVDSTTFDVPKAASFANVTVDNVNEPGSDVKISVKVPGDATGQVNIKIDGVDHLVDVTDGYANYTVKNAQPGNYTVVAKYLGDNNYNESGENTTSFTVSKMNTTIEATPAVALNNSVTIDVKLNVNATGNVTVNVNGTVYNATVRDGVAAVVLPVLANGTYDLTVNYNGDKNFNVNSTNVNFEITGLNNYTLDVKVVPGKHNENTTIIVQLPAGADGNVTVYVNGTPYDAEILPNGTAIVNVPLPAGDYEVNVTYANSTKYDPRDNNGTKFTVEPQDKYPLGIDVVPAPYGENTTITITAPKDIGAVNVTVDGVPYVVAINSTTGEGVLKLDNLTAGKHGFTASFAGNENYTAFSNSTTFDVPKAASFANVTVDKVNEPGSDVKISVKVPDNATGQVNIKINGVDHLVDVTDGYANYTIEKAAPGNYTIVAKYLGDENFNESALNESEITVNKMNTTIEATPAVALNNSVTIDVKLNVNATGNVTVKVNNTIYNATVRDGVATLILPVLANGTYDLTVNYNGDKNFNVNSTNVNFVITGLNNYTMDVDVIPGKHNENTTIVVQLPAGADGNVTVYVNGTPYYPEILPNGTAIVNVPLPAGDYQVNVTYNNSTKYDPTVNNGNNFTVEPQDKYPLGIDVVPAPYGENTTIAITAPKDIGVVNVTVDGVTYDVAINSTTGEGVLKLDNLTAGKHGVTASFAGNENYTAFSNSTTFDVPKAASFANVTVDKVNEPGSDVKISVKVPDNATGQVNIKINGQDHLVDVENGYANYTIEKAAPGNFTIVAKYLGDENFNESALNVSEITVNKMNTTIEATPAVALNNSVTIDVKLNVNATGNVTVNVNGTVYNATVRDGVATLILPVLANGTYDLTVNYNGDKNFNVNSTNVNFVVTGLNNYTMDVDVIPGKHNENTTIVVQLPAGADGNVTVYVNGTPYYPEILPNGTAIVNVPLPAGDYEVNVTYNNSTKYDPTENNGTKFTVEPQDKYPLGIDVVPAPYGENTTITITAPKDIGIVNVTVDGVTYDVAINSTTGEGVLKLDNLTAGKHGVTASFAGNENYTAFSNSTTFDVPKAASYANVTVTEVNEAGSDVKISVKVPGDATGQVNIKIDGVDHLVDVTDGYANYTIEKATPGNYTIVAKYLGDENFNESALNVSEITVNKMNTTIEATPVVALNNSVTIDVKLNVNATGNVTVNVNGTVYNATVRDGVATVVLPVLANGTYDLTVNYNGDKNFNVNSTNVNFVVTGLNNYTMDVDVIPGKHNENTTIVVQLPAGADGNVTVYVNGTLYYPEILPNGTAIVNVPLPAGDYEVNVTYNNSTKYDPTENNGTKFTVEPQDKYPLGIDVVPAPYGENTTITITAPKDIGVVNVTVDGVTYDVAINSTTGEGVLKLDNLTAGKHGVTASFAGNENYTAFSNSTTFDVPKAASYANVTVTEVNEAGSDVKISVKVPGDATGQVNIKIDGVDHLVDVTDGYANYTVRNVQPGNYTVVAKYLGDNNYNESLENVTGFKVSKMNTTISESHAVADNNSVTIAIKLNENATGNVTVDVDGTVYNATVKDGIATLVLPPLANGTYNLTVNYNGDKNFNATSVPVNFEIEPLRNTTMTVDITTPTEFGNVTTITVTIPDVADGKVTVWINETNYTAVFKGNGVFELVTSVLPVGDYVVNVTYTNGTKYKDMAKNDLPLSVKANDSYVLDVNVSSAPYGEVTNITVTGPANVTVTVTVDGVEYNVTLDENGTGVKQLDNLTAGKHDVVVSAGNENYTNKSDFTSFVIPKAASFADVNLTAVNEAGDNVTISVKVPGDATGQVNIRINGQDNLVTVENGYANLTVRNVQPGDYEVTAKYLGDDNYNESLENVTGFKVSKMNTTISESHAVADNNSVAITIKLNENATGNVTVDVDGTVYNATVKDGVATLALPPLSNGTYNLTVNYNGDKNFNATSVPVNFEIEPLRNTTMAVDITTPTEFGNVTTITVTIPDVADGKVTVWINETNYTAVFKGNGVFELVTPVLPVGDYVVNVTYTNGTKYKDMAKNDLPLSVKANDSYVLDVNVSPAPYGEVTNITVTGPANVTVTVTVDGVEYNVTLDENGTGVKQLDNLTAGKHDVVVSAGNENYTNKSDFTSFVIPKAVSTADITVTQVNEPGSDVTISVKVPEDAKGQVNINIEGVDHLVNVTDGYANYTLKNAQPGDYAVVAKYLGDDNYNSSAEDTDGFTVSKMNTTVTATPSVAKDNSVTIKVDVNENATGNVTVEVNGKVYNATVKDGVATLELPTLANGTYDLTVNYNGDGNFNENSTHAIFEVTGLNNYTMDVKVVPGKHNENTTVIVQLPAGADGNVTVYVNGTPYYPEILPNGTAIVSVPLPAGDYEVNVTYNNSTKYDPTENNGTKFTVDPQDKYPLGIDVAPAPYGENTTITITAPKDIDSVNVTIDGVTYLVELTDGVGKKTLNNLTAGKHEVIASFAGNENYTAQDNTTTFDIPKAASNINVTIDDKVFDAGDSVFVGVEVNDDATGFVNINIDGVDHRVEIKDGKANYTLENAQPGKHNVTVTYDGDDNYNSTSAKDGFAVDTFPTSVVVTPEIDDDNNVTLYVKVNRTATGNVTVQIGNKTFNGTVDPETGIAVINVGILPDGDNEINVTYHGDDRFNETSSTETITVPSLVNYELPVTSNNITYGDVAHINVTLPEGASADNLRFYVDGVETTIAPAVSGRNVQLSIPDLKGGDHTVVVKYLDDGKYADNTNSTTFNVRKQNATEIDKQINVTNDIHVGEVANVTVKLPADANGTITVDVNGTKYVADVINGVANISIPKLENGSYPVTITYSGDGNYEPFTATDTIVVEKVAPTIGANTTAITLGENAVINVTVPDDATGTVTIRVAGIEQEAAVTGGVNSIIVPGVPVGDHNVEVIYNGDGKYASESTSTELVVSPKPTSPDDIRVIDNGDGTVTVIVSDNATGNVTVKIGNETIPAVELVDSKAIVNLTKSNATPGKHNITVIYSGDGNHTPGEVNATGTIPKWDSEISASASTIREGDDAIVTVDVKPKDATGRVRVEVDGTGYYAEVKDGVATVVVSGLKEGTYDISVTYDGDDTYNGDNATAKLTVEAPITVQVNGTGNESQVVIELPTNDTGKSNITVKIDGEERNFTVENGTVKANLTGLEPGEHKLTVIYTDENNVTSVVETKIVVPKWSSEVSAAADTIREGDDATVTVTVDPDMTGSVRVDINGSSYIADIKDGKATVTVPGLKEGTYDGLVTYLGDDKYDPSNSTFALTVQAPIKVDVNGTGNESQVVIELPTNDTGKSNITVKIDGEERNFTVENGTVKANLTGLEPGEHKLTVIYTDENNVTSVVETKIVVPKWSSEVSAAADTIREGDDAKVTVTVGSDMTGQVSVTVDGKSYLADINNGTAVVYVPGLKEGTYNATVKYLGDDRYEPSNSTFPMTVQAPITAEVNGTGNGSQVVVNVPNNGTGNITVMIDGENRNYTLENGTVKANLTGLEPGEHNLTVIYTDENNVTSVVNTKINVPRWDSSVSASAKTIREGDEANIVVTVGGKDMTGLVRVDIDGTGYYANMTEGVVTIVAPGLKAGKYNATVTYDGNKKYDPSNNWFTVIVEEPIVITINDNGTNSQVVIDLPQNGTENVTVTIDGKDVPVDVNNRTAIGNLTGFEPGEHNITVVYTDEDGTQSIVNTTITVPRWDSSVNASAKTIREGDEANIVVTVGGKDMTGLVRVDIDGTGYYANMTEGVVTIVAPGLKAGKYEANVTYDGNSRYLPANNTFTLVVEAPITITVDGAGNSTQVIVELPENGTDDVVVMVDGKPVNTTFADGKAIAKLDNTTAGEHNVTVIYTDKEGTKSVVNQTIVVYNSIKANNMIRGWNSLYDYEAEFLDKDGHVIANTTMEFRVNGKTYMVTTDNKGIAKLTTSHLEIGEYDVEITNTQTHEKLTRSVTIVKRLIDNKDITLEFYDGTKYVVRAIGDDGKPVGAGVVVGFRVNNVDYNGVTDKDGYAKLTINLNPAQYTITAQYHAYKVSNKIVVKQTLKLVKKTVTVKKSAKKLVLKATLKWTNGKAIKGKKITFTFKGKKYTAKTNSKGLAKVTVKKSVLKKLKAGKKYAYSAKYVTNKVKGKVKVKK